MDRNEKLRLSAVPEWCHAFKQGMFVRLFEQGLHWFSHAVKPLKPMQERVKGGEPVVYGGLPIASFEKLVEDGALQQAEATEYGWKWPYAAQSALPGDVPEFAVWRKHVLAAMPARTGSSQQSDKPDIASEILAFNLAAHTPMQAMNAIAGWQENLRAGFPPARE